MAKWFVNRNGKQAGPFESAQLKKFASEGKIKPDDQIRRDDQEKWHKAESVKGLFLARTQPQFAQPKAAKEGGELRSTHLETQQNADLKTNENMPHQQSACDWYRIWNDQSVGPVPFTELCEQYKTGVFGANDFIAQAGMNWVQAGIFLEQGVVESATTEDEWFILSGDQTLGPHTFSHLQGLFKNKELSESTLIGRRGSKGIPVSDCIPKDSDSSYDRMLNLLVFISKSVLVVIAVIVGILSAWTFQTIYIPPLWLLIPIFAIATIVSFLRLQELLECRNSLATIVVNAFRKAVWIAVFYITISILMLWAGIREFYPIQYTYVLTCLILVLGLPAAIYKSSLLDSWYMNIIEIVFRLIASHLICVFFAVILFVIEKGSPEENIKLAFACSSIVQALIPAEWLPVVNLILFTALGQETKSRTAGLCKRCQGRGFCFACRGTGCSQCHPLLPGRCSDCDGTGGVSVLLKDGGVPNVSSSR